MAEMLSFEMPREDLGKMDRRALEDYLGWLGADFELDAREPRNMNSEAYEQWGERSTRLWRTWWTRCWTAWMSWTETEAIFRNAPAGRCASGRGIFAFCL